MHCISTFTQFIEFIAANMCSRFMHITHAAQSTMFPYPLMLEFISTPKQFVSFISMYMCWLTGRPIRTIQFNFIQHSAGASFSPTKYIQENCNRRHYFERWHEWPTSMHSFAYIKCCIGETRHDSWCCSCTSVTHSFTYSAGWFFPLNFEVDTRSQ